MKVDEVEYNGLIFSYRHDTTDWNIIREACGGLNTKYFDVEAGEFWIDFGAHIGAFTCYAASKGAKVMSIEPVPENYALLKENVIKNGLEKNVALFNYAVSDEIELKMYVNSWNYGNCTKTKQEDFIEIEVPTIPTKIFNNIENFCAKIDTEGCEYDILMALNLQEVNKLVFEYHEWLLNNPAEELATISGRITACFNNFIIEGGYMTYAWK